MKKKFDSRENFTYNSSCKRKKTGGGHYAKEEKDSEEEEKSSEEEKTLLPLETRKKFYRLNRENPLQKNAGGFCFFLSVKIFYVSALHHVKHTNTSFLDQRRRQTQRKASELRDGAPRCGDRAV